MTGLIEVIEEVLRLPPEMYYQDYWWLLVDDRDRPEPEAVYRRPEPGVWPLFFGHRVPLGGDQS